MGNEEEKKYTLDFLEEDLDEKQKKFAHEYIIDWAKARSYMKAYPDSTYESAAVSANRLLKNAKIQQYINYIKEDIEKESGITKLRQLKELSNIAYSSIAALHNTWVERKAFEDLTDEQKAAIELIESRVVKSIEDDEVINIEQVKIKLHSKIGALTEINKMMGYLAPDKVESTNINYNAIPTKEEAKEISDALESEV